MKHRQFDTRTFRKIDSYETRTYKGIDNDSKPDYYGIVSHGNQNNIVSHWKIEHFEGIDIYITRTFKDIATENLEHLMA